MLGFTTSVTRRSWRRRFHRSVALSVLPCLVTRPRHWHVWGPWHALQDRRAWDMRYVLRERVEQLLKVSECPRHQQQASRRISSSRSPPSSTLGKRPYVSS